MNYCAYFIAALVFFGMCTFSGRFVGDANHILEYQMDEGRQAVIVVMNGISSSEAKKMAKQRAAELTVAVGDRYFTIESEGMTSVVKSEDIPSNQRFNQNMYQELIQERNFGRQSLERSAGPNSTTYSGYRLVFTTSKEKSNWKAIDACSLTHCS